MATQLPPVQEWELQEILNHLKNVNIPINKYRKGVGIGRSQCFGMVRKRSLAPDLSRCSWLDPKLHGLLIKFGIANVPIPYTSIQVNVNYMCEEHKDKHNVGDSYIIGLGEYQDGALYIDTSGNKIDYDIRYKPLLFDGSKNLHGTRPFSGNRITLVYHTLLAPKHLPMVRSLSEYESTTFNGEHVIIMRLPGHEPKYLSKKLGGLPHPLTGRKVIKEESESSGEEYLTPAQNLILSAQNHRNDN